MDQKEQKENEREAVSRVFSFLQLRPKDQEVVNFVHIAGKGYEGFNELMTVQVEALKEKQTQTERVRHFFVQTELLV